MHALDFVRTLLDHGANPNAQFDDGWGNPFKVLTGVIGHGEGDKPPHPRASELALLLIERGADPYDFQALYNTSITRDDTTWLDILWTGSEQRDRLVKWRENPATVDRGQRSAERARLSAGQRRRLQSSQTGRMAVDAWRQSRRRACLLEPPAPRRGADLWPCRHGRPARALWCHGATTGWPGCIPGCLHAARSRCCPQAGGAASGMSAQSVSHADCHAPRPYGCDRTAA